MVALSGRSFEGVRPSNVGYSKKFLEYLFHKWVSDPLFEYEVSQKQARYGSFAYLKDEKKPIDETLS